VNTYNVYRGTTPGGEDSTPVATGVTTTSFVDSSLTNGTTYYFTVAAVNTVGTGPQSGEASATPQPTAPSAPLALTASGGNGSVSLSWNVPADNGGSPVTGYNVYRGSSPGGEDTSKPVATGVTATNYTDTGVTNGTTYYYKVAAVNSVGTSPQSSEAFATPNVPSAAAYVGRVGSATASTSRTTTSVTIGGSGVAAGHTLVVSLLLSSTKITGAVTATDTAGNTYVVARDTNDGSSADRTVVLIGVNVKALAAGAQVTVTYPSAAETHVSVDEFSGVTGIDSSAGATGTTASFSSGTAATTQSADVLIGVVGAESGTSPTWSSGWTKLPVLAISTDYLDTAYQLATAGGSYAASGTTSHQWMAVIVTLKTG
jgi:fibronectin type 3 domain-containing protein